MSASISERLNTLEVLVGELGKGAEIIRLNERIEDQRKTILSLQQKSMNDEQHIIQLQLMLKDKNK